MENNRPRFADDHATAHRRRALLLPITAVIAFAFPPALLAQSGAFTYRGFNVDISAALDAPDLAAIMTSVQHQIDIAADCGARRDLLDFFRSQEVVLKPGQRDGGGHFSPNSRGVTVDAAVQPPQKPILLHELMHAYHARILPGAARNPDLLRFYAEAKEGELYPPGSYVLSNVGEFFAVTGSLYLWGNVDRPPHTRETLRAQQPEYYQWLGQLFGVDKAG